MTLRNLIFAKYSCSVGCPDLVHCPAAIHQHTHGLSVLKGLLQVL